ncbi:MAG: SO2930 family diheme c-type cytochrome [Myxococcota bacterium]|nr:SO2930 family diheme c-type cytochrome [Myxococcota bacterium]
MRFLSFPILAVSVLVACVAPQPPGEGSDAGQVEPPAAFLSDYGFVEGELRDLQPVDGVLPYEPVAPLWSDGALKDRFMVVPPGEAVGFDPGEDWDFPLGSVIIKHFAFPRDLREPEGERLHVETRLMVLGEEGWVGEVYLWNEEQTDAEHFLPGTLVQLDLLDEEGEPFLQDYVVPSSNHCSNCHSRDDRMHLLGATTAQLNGEVERGEGPVNQLDWLAQSGLFGEEVPRAEELTALSAPFGAAPLEARARSYLHANCAHCHRPGGNAAPSGLFFPYWEEDPTAYGICKRPVAAGAGSGGRAFDVVPGDPDASILTFRVESTEPGIKMPELGNLLVHHEGVELLRDWIGAMEPQSCE